MPSSVSSSVTAAFQNSSAKVEKEIEKQIVDKTPHEFSPSPRSPRRSLPDLVPDDDGSSSSDDDSSLIAPDIANDDSDILGIPHESEGEMWDDHPGISPANNPRSPSVSLPEPELPPSPVRPVAPTPSPVRPVSPPAATIADNAGDVMQQTNLLPDELEALKIHLILLPMCLVKRGSQCGCVMIMVVWSVEQ